MCSTCSTTFLSFIDTNYTFNAFDSIYDFARATKPRTSYIYKIIICFLRTYRCQLFDINIGNLKMFNSDTDMRIIIKPREITTVGETAAARLRACAKFNRRLLPLLRASCTTDFVDAFVCVSPVHVYNMFGDGELDCVRSTGLKIATSAALHGRRYRVWASKRHKCKCIGILCFTVTTLSRYSEGSFIANGH